MTDWLPHAPAPPDKPAHGTAPSRGPFYFMIASAVALFVALIALAFTLFIGQGKDVGEKSPASDSAQVDDATEQSRADAQSLTESAAAVNAIGKDAACSDAHKDSSTIITYVTEAVAHNAWDDGAQQTVQGALQGLNSACPTDYSLAVHKQLTSGAAPTQIQSLVGDYAWITPARPAPEGAIEASSFTTPANNIRCRINDGTVACSIYVYDYPSPGTCEGLTATYAVTKADTTTAGCDYSVTAAEIYDYGTVISSNGFSCTLEQEGVTCWSELSGHGFTLKRAADETF